MKQRYVSALVALGAAGFVFGSIPASGQTVANAQSFAIVGGTAVAANGAGSVISGDVGVSPGTSITGFPGSAITAPPFTTHSNDGAAISAQASTLALYNSLAALGGAVAIGPQLSGLTLGPGTYSIGAADLASPGGIVTGNLTLSGAGSYYFKVAASLTANVNSTVTLIGVDPCQVYWQVTSAATLNGFNFVGNVVAQAAVTLGVGDRLVGRALTTSLGDVTLSGTNTVGGCSTPTATPTPTPPPPTPPAAANLFIVKNHVGNFVVGTNASYRIAIFNNGGSTTSGTYTVTDTLPTGLTFVSATGVGWTCSASGQTVTCTNGDFIAPGPGANSITLTVLPTAAAVPTVTNRAVVSGGGDAGPDDNTTIDVTVVSPIPTPTPVPTLPQWAMIGLTLLLAFGGMAVVRRRNI
jgi:type VI secretion system secreted protein VgrG